MCVGNLCRSPLAERLLQTRLDAIAPRMAVVTSAGTLAHDGREMHPRTAEQLARLGARSAGFQATRLTAQLVADADLVLTATKDLRTDVLRLAPRSLRRAFTMAEFAAVCAPAPHDQNSLPDLVAWAAARRSLGADAQDLEDPYGEPLEAHVRSAGRISRLVDAMAPPIVAALSMT